MYQRILLTIDGSELARTAIGEVERLASGTTADVHLVEVIDPIQTFRMQALLGSDESAGVYPEVAERMAQDNQRLRREAAHRDLEDARTQLLAAGIASVTTAVLDGLPGNEIVDYAAANQPDAIVMATRGHSGLGREVVGSVAEYVLRHAGDASVVLVGPRSKR